jgi:aminoglycoside phosphotransferase (APT) family kinase protein
MHQRDFRIDTIQTSVEHKSLGHWLNDRLPGTVRDVVIYKFEHGQSNPSYRLDVGDERYVLRRKPPGNLLLSAHAIDREFRVLSTLSKNRFPVPEPVAYCSDHTVIGSEFYIMQYIDGRIFRDPALSSLGQEERCGIYEAMTDQLAQLHRYDYTALGLQDFGKPENYCARQIKRWIRQYHDTELEEIPAMHQLMDWLPENLPHSDRPATIIHGDYRLENLIFHPTDARVLAVLDWELSTIGDPLVDLAYLCLCWQLPYTWPLGGLAGLDLLSRGIPTEQYCVTRYGGQNGSVDNEHWPFYLALNCFRLAAILQGVWARAKQGNASSQQALEFGSLAPQVAGLGWRIVTQYDND